MSWQLDLSLRKKRRKGVCVRERLDEWSVP
jgi:hypothetical protein